MEQQKKNKRFHVFLVLVIVVLALASTLYVAQARRGLGFVHVYFLDVGQGDAIFIVGAKGQQILIDGGPDRSVLSELGDVMPLFDRSIDLVINTHPDADHVAGLVDVLDRYDVAHILETGVGCDTALCARWHSAIEGEQADHVYAHAGERIVIDEDTSIEILYPTESVAGQDIAQRNNTSVITRFTYKGQSLLLTGDIEAKVEDKLVYLANLDSDFLKVAHHGSKTSTTQEFLDAVTPYVAFISVGADNRYGHPNPDVITRLEKENVIYYRTDTNGRIELQLDGFHYKVNTQH